MTSGGNLNPANAELGGCMDAVTRRCLTSRASLNHRSGTDPEASGRDRAQCNRAGSARLVPADHHPVHEALAVVVRHRVVLRDPVVPERHCPDRPLEATLEEGIPDMVAEER